MKVIIIQARTNSSRLPGKVLLPICGLPLVILAAKRASNTGIPVIIATSNERTDDLLSSIIMQYGFSVFRGELDNTLDRVVKAIDAVSDEATVVRLTADNVCPDGHLIDEVISSFIDSKSDYMYCNGVDSGLPYGMSLEITKAAHLREANRLSTSSYDKEHVTPYIIRKYGKTPFDTYKYLQTGHLQCTVDNLDDYISITDIFSNINDPININFLELTQLIDKTRSLELHSIPEKFVLGTAQLGLEYGINNLVGKPRAQESNKILLAALQNRVPYIDTASMYGDSEKIIGDFISTGWAGRAQITTKLYLTIEESESQCLSEVVRNKVYKSLLNLNTKSLDVLLLHRSEYLKLQDGIVWNSLCQLKVEGVIKKIGISVQNPKELTLALNLEDVEHIQLPYNILDWRWEDSIAAIKKVKVERTLTVHCRSIYLQGLLFSKGQTAWARAHVSDTLNVFNFIKRLEQEFNLPLHEILMSFVAQQEWVDGVVVGIETLEQLYSNLESKVFSGQILNFSRVLTTIPKLNENTLDPSQWK